MTARYHEFLGNLAQDPLIGRLENSNNQLRVLGQIAYSEQPRNIAELSTDLHMPMTTVSLSIRLLVASGYVERVNVGGRRTEHALTDAGRALHARVASLFELMRRAA